MTNKVILGCGDASIQQLVEVIATYSVKGYPPIVFAEPQISAGAGGRPHAWLYRFFGVNFIIEMPVLPAEREAVDSAVAIIGTVVDTLANPIKATVE
ncbi:MAG: hypothetical protein JXK94_13190 [Deltaproteobacteria bacterium]|nr:hypothetical protein [Deltaproteobacteria bacterium]